MNKRLVAREWLVALGCFLTILVLGWVVISNSYGGPDGHYSPSGPNAWADFWQDFRPYGIMGGGFF